MHLGQFSGDRASIAPCDSDGCGTGLIQRGTTIPLGQLDSFFRPERMKVSGRSWTLTGTVGQTVSDSGRP